MRDSVQFVVTRRGFSASVSLTGLLLFAGPLAAQFNGSWSGTTAQGKPVSFTVSGGSVTSLSFAARIQGPGCSADFEVEVTGLSKPISGGGFEVRQQTRAPGAVSYTFSGTFTSSSTATGTLDTTLNGIPGVPVCSGSGGTTWSATKSGGAPPSVPSVSIGDAATAEGSAGTTTLSLPVTLDLPASTSVMVDFGTSDGTATAGADYLPASGTLVFDPGQTSATIPVVVLGDALEEGDETFLVELSNPTNATLGDAVGVGTINDDDGGGCVTDARSLCLNGGRFRVTVEWRAPDGTSGQGNSFQLTSDSGYFWFFDPENVELVLKVLDGCSINSRFWVFAGGLTDVEATIRVTDTATGVGVTYVNPLGTPFQPIQDTQAFATCP